MTSSQHAPYVLGYTRATMVKTTGGIFLRDNKTPNEPKFGLQAATRLHEVGIASNRWSAIQR